MNSSVGNLIANTGLLAASQINDDEYLCVHSNNRGHCSGTVCTVLLTRAKVGCQSFLPRPIDHTPFF